MVDKDAGRHHLIAAARERHKGGVNDWDWDMLRAESESNMTSGGSPPSLAELHAAIMGSSG
jgi:hypothetical protein